MAKCWGKPVYRDQITPGDEWKLRWELHRLFTAPVLERYRLQHQDAITPTEQEILAATRYYRRQHRERIKDEEPALKSRLKTVEQRLADPALDEQENKSLEVERSTLQAQLKPPTVEFARWHLSQWKLQRHLYEEYNGGRLLFQQAGVEAFDAMHRWLQHHEQHGDFRIDDPVLRTAFYFYWDGMKHGAFLSEPRKSPQVFEEFLDPPWRRELKETAPLQEQE